MDNSLNTEEMFIIPVFKFSKNPRDFMPLNCVDIIVIISIICRIDN